MSPRKKRAVTVAAIVGTLLGLAGVAVAAILLSTTLSGSTAFADSSAAMEVQSASTSAPTGGVTCTATKLGGDAVKVDPKVKRVVSGSQSQTVPGTCKVSIVLKNTGAEALVLDSAAFTQGPPAGWSLPTADFTGATSLAPGATGTLTATVHATDAATAGPFAFKINWKPSAA